MHHLAQTVGLLIHGCPAVETSRERLAKNEENREVESEEDLDDTVDIVVTWHDRHDERVGDEELDDDVEHRDGENVPLEAATRKHFQSVDKDDAHLLPEALLSSELFVIFEGCSFFFRCHELLGLSQCFVLLGFLLDIFFGDFDKGVLETVQLDINLHFGEVLLDLLNQSADTVDKIYGDKEK